MKNILSTITVAALAVGLSGCTFSPKGTKDEVRKADEAGQKYELPREKRTLPDLPDKPTWRDVLHRAFYANGDLEASYWEWRAALARVEMASAWPNSNLQLGFDYMFDSSRMKSFNRTTVSAGFDPSMPLKMPYKVQQAGKVAYQAALSAGQKFQESKFEVQKKVLSAWWDYALMAERVRIEQDNVALLKMIADLAADRVRAGSPQQDMVKAQMEHRLAENQLENMNSELNSMRAMLNGMLARGADAPLEPPATLPEARPLSADDAALIAVGTDKNPELARLAADVKGRKDALRLAKMAFIPDISPTASFTGSVSQALGAMVMVPTAIPVINSQIKESKAMMRSNEAMLAQTQKDRAANYVATLIAMRNSERQTELYETMIMPKARQMIASSREAYAAGRINFVELVDSQRTLLDVRSTLAETKMTREKRLAELEALAGVDAETIQNQFTTEAQRHGEGKEDTETRGHPDAGTIQH